VIWQGDMNDMVLRSLEFCESPARIINITGADILSVREVAMEFGKLFRVKPKFIHQEAPTALLNNAGQALKMYGPPKVKTSQIIKWIAHWIDNEQELLGKPTHYEVRDGKY
jgi:hypothetical protein